MKLILKQSWEESQSWLCTAVIGKGDRLKDGDKVRL